MGTRAKDLYGVWRALGRQGRRWRGQTAGGLCLLGMVVTIPWRSGVVVGHSMEPTLPHGSLFLYDSSYYRHHAVCSGDVVVVRHGEEVWIKRVYAVGGASFWTLRSGDEREIRHDPIRAVERAHFARAARRLRQTQGANYRVVRLHVPAASVFLVGDNVTSEDSRAFGPVESSEILGRVVTLPGQRLGTVPEWIELSSPRFRQAEVTGKPLEKEAGARSRA